jgi:hypothetical protein
MRSRAFFMAVCLLAIGVAACGSDKRSSTSAQAERTSTSRESQASTSSSVAADSDLDWFSTPSGNISCLIEKDAAAAPADGYVRCDARAYSWPDMPPRPSDCEEDWGGAISLDAHGGKAELICVGDTVAFDPSADTGAQSDGHHTGVLAYGSTTRVDVFVCSSQTSGVTCDNTRTKHGFVIARGHFSLY